MNEQVFNPVYPLFTLDLGTGLHALEGEEDGSPIFALAVFTSESAAKDYMDARQLRGTLNKYEDARSFSQLLQGVRHPTTLLAFDPKKVGEDVETDWHFTIHGFIDDYLPPMISWHYPVYLIREGLGYSSISGLAEGRGDVQLVCVFTDTDLAETYRQKEAINGSVHPVNSAKEFADFLRDLHAPCRGIVLDPSTAEQGKQAKWCIDASELLSKGLKGF